MLKSKNQVTLFVNYSYNSFNDLRFSENMHSEQKVMSQNMGFWIYMEVIYEHPFNRYPRDWSSYFYTQPMVSNELH